ncbi:MAG TPA: 16S rRNA (uracil(1498)-N(3))-methyltransferase [Candidatus Binatia bacterium]|nr:16S rRNA (uracil(1498)-N(3))-methyltransferase [Candidatus Binatia bacterium]
MPRFFIAKKNIQGNRGIVVGDEVDHLRKVLRLGAGDSVTLFDDEGREHTAVIRDLRGGEAEVEILSSYPTERESPLQVALALALTKGEKMDWVVEKATELGVHTIIPFVSKRTVPKLDDRKIAKRGERWQKIALSAAKQCGRTRVPAILPLSDFHELIEQPRSDTLKLLFWEQETRRTLKEVHASRAAATSILLVIGPEGGFSSEEASLAIAHGFQSIHLGRRILRAETAAITAISLVQFLWGDLG